MEPGEFQMRQAFEEVTTKNVQTVIEYTKHTRDLFRDLEKRVVLLEGKLLNQDAAMAEQRNLIVNLQTKLFSGGTT